MRYELPIELQEFLEERLDGVSRLDLRERALRISDAYRADGDSATIAEPDDALAYAVVRMPGTFAATRAAAERVAEALPGFAPASLLDVGAGPGATTRACRAVWPSIEEATLLDHNPHLLAFASASFEADGTTDACRTRAGRLPQALDTPQHRAGITGRPNGRGTKRKGLLSGGAPVRSPAATALASSAPPPRPGRAASPPREDAAPRTPANPLSRHGAVEEADLVVAAYVLNELAPAEQAEALDRLWSLTRGVLLLVEPGTSAGFARLLDHREQLLALDAHIVAPCSHAGACPLADHERWCHFAQRLPRSRAHRDVKNVAVAFEDEKYGYLAFSREPADLEAVGLRVLATPRVTKGDVTMPVCTPGTPTDLAIRRNDKAAYKRAKKLDWGDAVRRP